MRFDAYAGTLRDVDLDAAATALSWSLGGVITRGRGVRRYSEVLRVEHGGHCAVWVGRDRGNDCIYFEGKGETSPDLVSAVRRHFPSHTVARADVCEDYDADGAFDRLRDLVRAHKGQKVDGAYVRLPDDEAKGRTWSAGARGGVAMVRVYEAGKMPERQHLGRPHWARLELEARPHYADDKRAAASMGPLEFWGLAGWTKRVAEAVTSVDVPRYEGQVHQHSFDRTTAYLARTFRRHWEEMLSEGRDWSCIGREFEAIWKADDDAQATTKRGPGR